LPALLKWIGNGLADLILILLYLGVFFNQNSMIRFLLFMLPFTILSCNDMKSGKATAELTGKILQEASFDFVKNKAIEIVKTGFNAGDGYGEVWIRDYNTFIELSVEVFPDEEIQENLLVFFRMQSEDGNIMDGFIPKTKITGHGYDYIYSDLEPRYAGHKNTVETDQEASLTPIERFWAGCRLAKANEHPALVGLFLYGNRLNRALQQELGMR
jgi:hypothetical protein